MSEWHVNPELAHAYSADRLSETECWSVEAHLEGCPACARAVSSTVTDPLLTVVRERLLHQVATPARGFLRLTLVPALSGSWLLGVLGVVVGVTVLDLLGATQQPVLLIVAPLLPLLGVALGCSRAVDPSAELMASTPVPALRVLLLRAVAVLAASVLPLLAVSVLTGVGPLAWLTPAVALVALSLALTTVLRVEVAAGVAGGLWVALVTVQLAVSSGSPWVFQPPTQLVWAGLAAVFLAVLVLRREDLDEEGFIR